MNISQKNNKTNKVNQKKVKEIMSFELAANFYNTTWTTKYKKVSFKLINLA